MTMNTLDCCTDLGPTRTDECRPSIANWEPIRSRTLGEQQIAMSIASWRQRYPGCGDRRLRKLDHPVSFPPES